MAHTTHPTTSPLDYVAIAVAAQVTSDRRLLRAALRRLRIEHGIRLSFIRRKPPTAAQRQEAPP